MSKTETKKIITFQEIIERLNTFWGNKGCVVAQPYGLEVGAGTANPSTFLRSLGPEPFNVAYVEPSRRPDDGRYGKNPYRLQHYFQYQVILKPAPANNQELYFEMLGALGIDTKKHDIRFVEDNWESPAIGAWGLGWEVWLDGMEISQYTYFQQVSGIPLEVPTLEITLGLERLAMYIQGVEDYRDIMWNEDVKYGDLFEKHEYWQSKHNYETADIDDLKKIYDLNESQVQKQLDVGNYWVAYDYLLKISHIFNILDSRGVVSVTDRIGKFKTMGHFSKKIGDLYLAEREKMGYPLSRVVRPVEYKLTKNKALFKGTVTKGNKLALELYFEELPADFVMQWKDNCYRGVNIEEILENYGFKFKDLKLYWGTRRVVLVMESCSKVGLVEKQIVGPLYDMVFDGKKLSKIGEGFLNKYKGKCKDIVKIEKGGKDFAGLQIEEKTTLEQALLYVIEAMFSASPSWKSMKWLSGQDWSFVRPLRNIVCFQDEEKIDLVCKGVRSSEYTFCTRYSDKDLVLVLSANDYLNTIKKMDIVIDETYREGLLRSAVQEGEAEFSYSPNTQKLVRTNAFLVEYPNIKFLKLDEKYVGLPIELISKVLEENQKYIIRVSKVNSKHIEFGVVSNKKDSANIVFKGNLKVVQGRLDDALFYWENDLRGPKLKDLRNNLESIIFHPKIGSYKDRVSRIENLVSRILKRFNVKVSKEILKESLQLIKNDKATHMVGEFASLEGVIGAYYARREGYGPKVAKLLRDHYLPTSDSSSLPSTTEGVILSLADKLDHIISFTEVGLLPEGSNDPYEVRKNIYNLIRLLRESKLDIDIYEFLKDKKLIDFVNQRIYQVMKDKTKLERLAKGVAYSENGSVFKKFEYLVELDNLIKTKDDEDKIFDTIKRVYNILEKDFSKSKIDEKIFETKSERELYKFLVKLQKNSFKAKDLITLSDLLEKFFDETMVNVDDKKLKGNRTSLLKELSNVLNNVVK